ncbi:T9SS type A sorting domain-containing protein [Aureispira sp. CCB-E]|uniref:T9SS type A sorting domain-containing protein n=1 Tax=Aureispira sp. CCB-E TaxID=3051121 RepID=UPI0028697D19|nr:T9SS type A sorting domain-containing protein [Aureispira sp. CCB-E]WMX16717.1 T9SS type A sorting domain-containing protein [Aureispira sp. CCB-E]
MKLYLHYKLLFIGLILLLSLSNILAQPCVFAPPISSTDTSGNTVTTICNGNPLTLSSISSTSCPSCTYLWSTGETNSIIFAYTPGLYSVTVTDNSGGTTCVGVSATLDIKASTLPAPVIEGDPFNVCNTPSVQAANLEVKNPCVTCTYQWYNISSSAPIAGATQIRHSTVTPESYYVQVIDTLGCLENSNILSIGAEVATTPPINATAKSICDSNSTSISTIDCAGCNYEWHYYDFLPEGKLIISGVYDGTRPNGTPKGIELYAIGNIPDLSAYGLSVSTDGSGVVGTPGFFFPAVSLAAESYIYVAFNNADFIDFFGFAPDYTSNIMNIDGNDAIKLFYNGTPVDLFGDEAYVSTDYGCTGLAQDCYDMPYSYRDGWAYRKTDSLLSVNFNAAAWDFGKDNYVIGTTNSFWGTRQFPTGTFTNSSSMGIDSLIITGVYDGTITPATGLPKGIELQALYDIHDLSAYNIKVALNGAGSFGSSWSLPSGPITAGTFIYVASESIEFTNFFGFTPSSIPGAGVGLDQIDGNDCIALSYGTTVIDQYGEETYLGGSADYTMNWAYDNGWAYRNSDDSTNGGSFDVNKWRTYPSNFLPTNDLYGSDRMPIQSYTNSTVGTILQIIPGADSSTYTTDITGYYSVEVQYPNSCIVESALQLIDTSIFRPQITSEMPSLVGGNASIISQDTAYLCSGSYVELYMIENFAIPPTWSYQWFRNGVAISGEIGYNYRAQSAGRYSVQVTNEDGCTSVSNFITILPSNNGASPPVFASSLYLCSTTSTSTLSTPSCSNCSYTWKTEDGSNPGFGNVTQNSYLVKHANAVGGGTGARGYFVIVEDDISQCAYSSAIIEIKDTTYPAPLLTTNDNTVCSATPINLTTTPCAGCNYIWLIDSAETGNFITYDSTQQFTFQVDTSGNYRLEILHPNGCRTNFSNTIQATFQTVNADIVSGPTSICNGTPVVIEALPDSATSCPGCQYQFLRDGVRMQITNPQDEQEISLAGDYQVIVTNEKGCSDTSVVKTFTEVNISTNIRQSTKKICSPTSSMILEIDSCTGCSYQWFLGNTRLVNSQDTFYNVIGYSAIDTYSVKVSYGNGDCVVADTVVVDSVAERTVTIGVNTNVSQTPTICDGSAVVLQDIDTCDICQYQWFNGGDMIVGASFEAYQVDTPSTYYVVTTDTNNCVAVSNSITVQSFAPPTDFLLDFDTLSVLPITYGTFSLDDYLYPTSLRNTGGYTSLTANGAIITNGTNDSLNVGAAGSGYHYITYAYTTGNAQGTCTFSTTDTIEVLGAVAMDILNKKQTYLSIPASEACLYDTLVITVTNFTFIPNEVIFVAGGGNTISVPVSPSLNLFAGVYTGAFEVIVPAGARTGKITLSDGTDSYESPNFYLINNPAVTINLLTGAQPICSNIDTAEFVGLPLGGDFSAHYLGMSNNASLLSDSLLLLDSVTGYVNGIQDVMMVYTYTPLYTGTTIECRDSVVDSLQVEIRDVKLDSVTYTPISRSQTTEDLSNLTLITHPITAQYYPNNYTGTYVLGSAILPNTIPDTLDVDSITYQINNGGCFNESTDPIDIWEAPRILDAIPSYLCSKDDTVFIQRDLDSIWVTYRGNIIYSNTLYKYTESPVTTVGNPAVLGVRYVEKINLMEITTTNGGVDSLNFFAPNDEYYVVPANVANGATTLNLKFSYERISNFFVGGVLSSRDTTSYVIAEVSKNFIIEQPPVVAINPVILADTIFCPINNNNQFLGLPAGGQYYISGVGIGYDSLRNNIFNPTNYPTGASYGLTYVYEGQACVDSAYTGIYLPDPFSIGVLPNNGTGEYCKTSPNDSIFFSLLTPVVPPPTFGIDTASAQFFINNIQSGTVFSPTQVGPPGQYNVRYVVSDIYGCQEEATDIFVVHPIPNLAISPIDPIYCLNDDTTQIHLYQIDTANNTHTLTTWAGSGGIGYVQNETVEFTGDGIINGGTNPAMPYFYPRDAGVGVHDIRYVYADSNACVDSINFTIEVLSLPNVSMLNADGSALKRFYCENDSISLQGFPISQTTPSGYGTDTSALYGNPLINSTYPTSLDSLNKTFKPHINGPLPGTLDEVLFYYYENPQGCRDTARYRVTIRNFTTDPIFKGFPTDPICASDTSVQIWADTSNGGFDLDSLASFTCTYPSGIYHIPNTDTIYFYPDSMGIQYAGREVVITMNYTDTSKSCFNSISDTVLVRALPHLTLSEQIVSPLAPVMDLPGELLNLPQTDTFHHICETAPRMAIHAYNKTGSYNQSTGAYNLLSTHITPDTGNYVMGRGIQDNGSSTNIAYGYIPSNAGYGKDTIRYVYTDINGCTDSVDHYIFVDSLPVLAFAGLEIANYDADLNRYVYCETDPTPPRISATPSGITGSTLIFNGQSISLGAPFNLTPATLAIPGVYVDYPIQYNYIGQRYVNGDVCASSLSDTIQIRPAPQLAWVNVPTTYCMLDTLERLPLSATPYGGQFVDATNNFQVIAGIVGDSLFNPSAQPGKRDIYYYYLDTVSGCDDTIQHTIYVYSKPRINFEINGGCSGAQVEFIPKTAPYGLENNGVAIDSITMVIWNFGDGVSDTLIGANLPNTLGIPVDTHTYFHSGIFYPSLTVVNQGICDTTFIRRIIISPRVHPTDSTPYVQNFDLAANGWMQESSDTTSINGIVQDSLWEWGSTITANFSGTTFWGTRFKGTNPGYRPEESAWVYSPCFDLTSLDRPMIKMSIWKNTRRSVDGAVLQYHDNATNTWQVLGQSGKGVNWYQDGYVVSNPGNQINIPVGWSGASSNFDWEDARYRLDNIGNDLRTRTDVRFRVAFASAKGPTPPAGTAFAFDSVRIGNRTRNVLTEHFSGHGYAAIAQIEDQLYHTIFNNLYGRDVSLVQYHLNIHANDIYYNYNNMGIINDTRKLWYGVGDVNRVRIDGKNLVSKTSDLLNYPQLEYLDIESLQDPLFKLEFVGVPAIRFNGASGLEATVRITALEDLPIKNYALHVVATEDSLTSNGHTRMAVLRDKHINATGQTYPQAWTAGDSYDLVVQLPNININNNPILSRIQLVAFVQDMGSNSLTKEVYQTISSRNLTVFNGPVDTLDVSIDNIEDQLGYEVATLKLYPNPTQQLFNVEFEAALEDDYEWQLVDVVGRVLKNGKVEAGTSLMQVKTEDLTAGMYIFIVKNKNVYTQRKVIVQQY